MHFRIFNQFIYAELNAVRACHNGPLKDCAEMQFSNIFIRTLRYVSQSRSYYMKRIRDYA